MSTRTLIRGADLRDLYVVGIDPGPVVGIAGLLLDQRLAVVAVDVAQCTDRAALRVLEGLRPVQGIAVVLAGERFVVGPLAGRVRTPAGGRAARETMAQIAQWAHGHQLRYVERRAADVKPWATDTRLDRVGLLEPTRGMRHARDAARHALYAAVRDCGLVDPLSRKGGRRDPE